MSNVAGIPSALKFYYFIPLVIHGLQEMGVIWLVVNAPIKLCKVQGVNVAVQMYREKFPETNVSSELLKLLLYHIFAS